MITLALDTATSQASVALRVNGLTVAEEVITASDGHSHLLYQMIEAALAKAGVALHQVDCFASAVGPGSFTGVRLCLAAAKGLADALDKPAIGISNLQALATFATAPFRCPIIDARRGQFYTAIYDSNLALVSPEILINADEWLTDPGVERITITPPLAAAIAFCAERSPEHWRDPAVLDARYLRHSDADSQWQDLK